MRGSATSIARCVAIQVAMAGVACHPGAPARTSDAGQPDSTSPLDVATTDHAPGDVGASTLLGAVAAIIAPTCAVSDCHDAVTKSHGMDLSTADGIYAAWVNKPGLDHCDDRPRTRVVPGDPAGSFVMAKIAAVAPFCDLSTRMPPPPRPMLTPGQIETIRAWIAAGAPPAAVLPDGGRDPDGDVSVDARPDDETGGGDDGVDPGSCSANNPCPTGSNCTADSCSGPWMCLAHYDETLEHPCEPDLIPYCGCDGVTFEASSTCPDRPWSHVGACDDGFNCNYWSVTCSDPQPTCPAGQVPSVIHECYGPCVPISQCRCLYHWMCPDLSINTCLLDQHRCGPQPNLVDAGTDGAPDDGAGNATD